jgi:twinkle protein
MVTLKPPALNAAIHERTNMTDASVLQKQAMKSSTTATTVDGLAETAKLILEARKLNIETLERLGWRSIKTKRDGEWICIPYKKHGVTVNNKYRRIDGVKEFSQDKDGEKIFYNHEIIDACLKTGETLVITEGEVDCVTAIQCGYYAISVPDGAPAKALGKKDTQKYTYLDDFPAGIKKIIIAVDSDDAGANLLQDLSIRLDRAVCHFVRYPQGCKDLNEALVKFGEKGVHETLKRAKPIEIDGLYTLNELPPLPQHPALSVGIQAIDDNFKLRKGDFSVVTGIPSMGKSTFINNVMVNMVIMHGWHVTFASFEQPPQTEHRRVLRILRKGSENVSPHEHEKLDEWINDNFSFIVPSDEMDEQADLSWLLNICRDAVIRYGSDCIVIDPWNEIEHSFSAREMSETQYISFAIKEIRKFARKYQVHMMVIAHPAKMQKDKASGKYPIPTLYDISGSAHWYNKADQGIVVHRDDVKTILRVAKSRYHTVLGRPADVDLRLLHNLQYEAF